MVDTDDGADAIDLADLREAHAVALEAMGLPPDARAHHIRERGEQVKATLDLHAQMVRLHALHDSFRDELAKAGREIERLRQKVSDLGGDPDELDPGQQS